MPNVWSQDAWQAGVNVDKSAIKTGILQNVIWSGTKAELQALTAGSLRYAVISAIAGSDRSFRLYAQDTSDTTSTDDGDTVLVTADSKRFYLVQERRTLRRFAMAEEIMRGEEGIAFDFRSRTYKINDYTGALTANGRPASVLTFTRGSAGTYVGRDRLVASAASNVIRYHHDPVTGVPLGVLLEGTRTNLCLQSETLDNASWTKSAASVTANAVASPDGAVTADTLVEDSTTAAHYVEQAISGNVSTQYTFSIWAKANTRTKVQVEFYNNGATIAIGGIFDLSAGSVSAVNTGSPNTTITPRIEAYADGWYRCVIGGKLSSTSSAENIKPRVTLVTGTSTTSYLGDGSSGAYLWGAQLEAANDSSSYIVTTTASVARSADAMSIAVTAFPYDLDNQTMYARFRCPNTALPTAQNVMTLHNGGTNQFVTQVGTGGSLLQGLTAGGVNQGTTTVGTPTNDGRELSTAVAFRVNDYRMATNFAKLASDTTAAAPASLATLVIGNNTAGTTPFFGTIAELAVISRAFTSAGLQELCAS